MSETPAIPPSVQSELQEVEARVDAIPVKPESRQLLHDLRWLISHVHWGYQSAVVWHDITRTLSDVRADLDREVAHLRAQLKEKT